MKKLSVYSVALLFVVGTTSALASGRDHQRHSNDRHNAHRGHQGYTHYYEPYYRHGDNKSYGYRQSRRGFYQPSLYKHSHLSAALIRSVFSFSFYHRHSSVVCYDSHGGDRRDGGRYEPRAGYSEVVGCHRIEHLSDGTQRRVEVPRSQCE